MRALANSGLQMAALSPCLCSSQRLLTSRSAISGLGSKITSRTLSKSLSHVRPFLQSNTSAPCKFNKVVTRAMSGESGNGGSSGLAIDLRGKRAFIAGVADDNGYGWAIAKALAAAGADILVGTWVPVCESSPMILLYKCSNIVKYLLETSRSGYLAAISASSYSFISLLQHFLPIMNPGGATVSLTYIASERTIPGYGGGMSSAKATLESDTRVLAFEAGRKSKIRVNTISAGPLGSRAAKAIGFIEKMIEYSCTNAPLQKELLADEVGNTAAFLVSPLASAITGSVIYVDNGLNTMGLAIDSVALSK